MDVVEDLAGVVVVLRVVLAVDERGRRRPARKRQISSDGRPLRGGFFLRGGYGCERGDEGERGRAAS